MAAVVQTYTAPPIYRVAPAHVHRIAVWCGPHLWIYDHRDPRLVNCIDPWGVWPAYEASQEDNIDLADLVEVCFRNQCGALWLVPAQGKKPTIHDPAWMRDWQMCSRIASARSSTVYSWHELSGNRGTALVGWVVQKKDAATGIGRGIPLGIYATWFDAWPILDALEAGICHCPELRARETAIAVMLAAYALGAQLRFSPSYTGSTILRQTLAPKSYDIPPLDPEWRALLEPILPSPVMWRAQMLAPRQTWPIAPRRGVRATARAIARGSLTIRKFDRINSYIASAREVPVGNPTTTDCYLPGLPGVYHVSASAPAHWPARMPGLFRVGLPGTEGEYPHEVPSAWAWEAQIRAAVTSGWHLHIRGGYVWAKTQKHDLLRDWQSRMWQAICSCGSYPGAAGVIARRICKRIGVATVGRLNQGKGHKLVSLQEARDKGLDIEVYDVAQDGHLTGMVEVIADLGRSDLLMPHWWATIISNANERLMQAIYTYAPHDTTLAYIDAFYTLRDHAEIAQEGQGRLGKFRHEDTYTVPLTALAEIDQLDSAQAVVKWLVNHG